MGKNIDEIIEEIAEENKQEYKKYLHEKFDEVAKKSCDETTMRTTVFITLNGFFTKKGITIPNDELLELTDRIIHNLNNWDHPESMKLYFMDAPKEENTVSISEIYNKALQNSVHL